MASNSTTRFSDRVEDYVKYRPHYPTDILTYLQDEYSFNPSRVVADIGSGTGISTELFLRNGNKVFAVEPNREMRLKAEELLTGYPKLVSVDGTAEATGLPDASIDMIVAGQAFHWFDAARTRVEFARIARPGSAVILIWNERLIVSDFEREYEALILRYAGDYNAINHKNITDSQFSEFFHPRSFLLRSFENEQRFDFDGLRGRLLSSSYIPKEGPVHEAMMKALAALFERQAVEGKVRIGYETKVYSAEIS